MTAGPKPFTLFVCTFAIVAYASAALGQGLPVKIAEDAFVEAVADYCLPSVIGGVAVDTIHGKRLRGLEPFEEQGFQKQSPDAKRWTMAGTSGVVQIENLPPKSCRVSSYGISSANVFKRLEKKLKKASAEFVEDNSNIPQRRGQIQRGFVGNADGDEIRIFLSGAEIPAIRSSVYVSIQARPKAKD